MKLLDGVKERLPALGAGRLVSGLMPRLNPLQAGAMAAATVLLLASAGYAILLGADPQAAGPRFVMAMPHLKGPDRQALITPPPRPVAPETPTSTAPLSRPPATPVVVPVMPADPGRAPPSFAALPALPAAVPLPAAPVPGLLKDTPKGKLPVVAADGRTSARLYARPFAADGRPFVAVVITGLGLDPEATRAAISRLPPEVSLSFSPYASGLDGWIAGARNAGHEVLLDLPLEPLLFPAHDTGPEALNSDMAAAAAVDRLEGILAKAGGYIGVVGSPRSPVANSEAMTAVVASLHERGLAYVGDTLPPRAPANLQAAVVSADVDAQPFRGAIDAQLKRAAGLAQTLGNTVVVASPLPVTFERISEWARNLAASGVGLGPVSAAASNGRGR